ncbi:MAG: hypothetical protein JWO89_3668 [Verrucomicrobiaceae bacterium]|nr:hypothetical protein [Verrucomicrobiaceae bacterium]MDB6117857.1 hypothetical protein [Verrucomicrobiaceae bacterium]
MIVTTSNQIDGSTVSGQLGIVRGIVVRSNNIVGSFIGQFRTIFGGNIVQFERMCDAARQTAYDRMVEHAQQMGADAIIAMRFDATEFSPGVTEVLAYGTAVRLSR